MREAAVGILMLSGAFVIFVAGVGLARFPDFYMRTSATAKGVSMGSSLLLCGAALHFDDWGVTARALLVILFFVLTSPIASHRVARAAYRAGARLWEGTFMDELRDRDAGKQSLSRD
jgi:multicomponent Na+:H+ antiporter subunit G